MTYKTSILLTLVVLGLLIGTAQASTSQVSTKYLGWDKNFNTAKMLLNITVPETGKTVYVENYYSVDSYGKPKFYSSSRYETYTTDEKLSFVLHRPKDGKGIRYSVVEKILVINGKIATISWVDLNEYWSNPNF